MWPFSLLKKLSQDPAVGQTRGDYIGCYLLGTHTSGRDDDISYISLATTREQLHQDARQYLQEFLEQHPQLNEAERLALQDLLEHWNARADAHLAQDRGQHREARRQQRPQQPARWSRHGKPSCSSPVQALA